MEGILDYLNTPKMMPYSMSYDDGLSLLAGGQEYGQGAVQQTMGGGKRSRRGPKTINKVTYVLSRQVDGSYAATATTGGGFLGGGQKKQFVAPNIGSLLTQIGDSVRKAFSYGIQPQYAQMQPQQYPQQRPQQQYQSPFPQQPFPQGAQPQQQYVPPMQQAPPAQVGKSCGKCGAEISDAAAFCGSCGSKYEAPKVVKAFCTGCGAQSTGAAFCGSCGTKIGAPSA